MIRIISIIAVIFFLLVIALSYKRGDRPKEFMDSDSFMENVLITHVTSNVIDWTAKIGKVTIDPDNKMSRMQNITFQFPGSDVNIRSASGTFDMLSDDLTLADNVTATKKDMHIQTGSVLWDSDERTIKSDAQVRITSDFYEINGNGLEIDSDGIMVIKKNVRALVH